MDKSEALLRFFANELAALRLFDLGVDATRGDAAWLIVSGTNQPLAIVHDDARIDFIPEMAEAG